MTAFPLTLFDQGIRKFLPPGTTRRHLHDILNTLEHNQPGSGTSLTEMLARAHPLLKRKGMIVLISDFFCDPTELFRALNPYLHRGFRVQLFHILDPGSGSFLTRDSHVLSIWKRRSRSPSTRLRSRKPGTRRCSPTPARCAHSPCRAMLTTR